MRGLAVPAAALNVSLSLLQDQSWFSTWLWRSQWPSGASCWLWREPELERKTGSPLCWGHTSSLEVFCCADQQICAWDSTYLLDHWIGEDTSAKLDKDWYSLHSNYWHIIRCGQQSAVNMWDNGESECWNVQRWKLSVRCVHPPASPAPLNVTQ